MTWATISSWLLPECGSRKHKRAKSHVRRPIPMKAVAVPILLMLSTTLCDTSVPHPSTGMPWARTGTVKRTTPSNPHHLHQHFIDAYCQRFDKRSKTEPWWAFYIQRHRTFPTSVTPPYNLQHTKSQNAKTYSNRAANDSNIQYRRPRGLEVMRLPTALELLYLLTGLELFFPPTGLKLSCPPMGFDHANMNVNINVERWITRHST